MYKKENLKFTIMSIFSKMGFGEVDFGEMDHSGKCPFGKISIQWNAPSAKPHFDEADFGETYCTVTWNYYFYHSKC